MSKKIEDVLKCDICNKIFDTNHRRPFIAKCGHTFCKHCILSNNNESNNCPFDNTQCALSIESCIPNLKLEDVIRIMLSSNEEKKTEKKIVYMKPEIKRNKSPIQKNELVISQKNIYNRGKIRSSTANKYSTEFKFIHNEPMFFGNTNTNMKMGKVDFEDSKINDEINETIETIPPINDDKNIMNLSFKDEMNILLKKNTKEKNEFDKDSNEIIKEKDEISIENKIKNNKEKECNNHIFDMDDSLDKISRIDDEFLYNVNNTNTNDNINFASTSPQLNLPPTEREKDKQENLKKITKNIHIDFQRLNSNNSNNQNTTYYKIYNNKPFISSKISEKNSMNTSKEKFQTSNLTPRKYNNVFISSCSNSKNFSEINGYSEQSSRYLKNKSVAPYKHQLVINNSNSSNLTSITINNNMKTDRIVREEENNDDNNKKNNSIEEKDKNTKTENSYISAYNPHTNFKILKLNIPQKKNNNLSLNSKLNISNNSNNSPKKTEISIEEIKEKLIKELEKQNTNSSNYNKYLDYIEKSLLNKKLINPQSKYNLSNLTLKINPHKDIIIGFFDENLLNIKYGIQYCQNGDYYEGELSNNKREGNGLLKLKNGTIYEGCFKNNKHNGYGKLTQLDGEIFAGEWKEGKIDGNGIRYHSNGDKYIGNYKNNLKHGQGHYIFSNGNSYDGNWENGKANGKGKFTFKNGNFYEGEFKDNIICGKGTFTMKNGDCYIGIFKNGLINGRGIFKNIKGEKFNGFFYNGKKHGSGKLYDKDGNLIASGYWNMDKFVGKKVVNEFF